MTRAEQAALKAYPHKIEEHPKVMGGSITFDANNLPRGFYQEGYEQAEKDTIERACKWIFSHLPILVDYYDEDIHTGADRSEFIKLFRTQMEE